MMLFKLSLKNIRKSIKDYAIYFFTLILGIAIFYVFNAIDDQTVMLDVSNSIFSIIKLLTNMLSGVSIFVSFILAFLIIYASRFLMKRRNKEFGIYLTLGMSKRKISLILFFETLIIGVFSLVIGLGVGFLLSQLMSILVANMFEANLNKFTFIFSKGAFLKTLLYFGIMYLVVMIFNTINISKCKLIDLIQSNKKSEKIKLKTPYICIIIFILACIMLGYAYYLVIGDTSSLSNRKIFSAIGLGAISTFLIFWSLSGFLLRIFMNMKKVYYKGLNSFILRQFSSKINTTVFSTTIICLMLFITICVLSTALSMKNSLNQSLITFSPRDVELIQIYHDSKDDDLTEIQKENSKLNFDELLIKYGFDIKKEFKNITYFSLYYDDNITLKSTLGSYYKIAKEKYPFLRYDENIILMKNSDYNRVAKSFGLEKIKLNSNQYVVVGNYKEMINIKNEALKRNAKVIINDNAYFPKYKKAVNGFYGMGSQGSELGFIVLPDEALSGKQISYNRMIADYRGEANKVEEKLNSIMKDSKFFSDCYVTYNTKKDIREASVGIGALVTFLGLYLGIVFLISCAAMLALKELSESSDNDLKFNMLRRLGVDEKMINKTLFIQIGIFFMFPLILAIIHSIFGIIFCNVILETMGISFNLMSIIFTAILIVIIYGGYFLVTYLCSKNIIKEK